MTGIRIIEWEIKDAPRRIHDIKEYHFEPRKDGLLPNYISRDICNAITIPGDSFQSITLEIIEED